MRDIDSIWRKPVYLPFLQPELTEETLRKAEEEIGYQLPKEFVELLKVQNGGYIRKRLKDTLSEQIFGIGPFFPSLTSVDWGRYQEWVSFQLEGLVAFDGDGHWFTCLDYRENSKEPKVTYIDTECDHEVLLAESFSRYLAKLTLDVDDQFAITTDKSLEQIVDEVEEVLSIKLEEQDDSYKHFGGRINESWIWLSPNIVPYGVIQKEDKRYEELAHLTKDTTLRFPEIQEDIVLLSFSSEQVKKESIEKLKTKEFAIFPLEDLIKKG